MVRSCVRLVAGSLLLMACAADMPAVERADAVTPRPETRATVGLESTTTRGLPDQRDGTVTGTVPPVPHRPTGGAAQSSGEPARFEGSVLVFGDSVARLIVDDLAAVLPGALVLDAVDCRRIDRGFNGPCGGVPAGASRPSGLDALRSVISSQRQEAAVPDAAVVVLANNSSLAHGDLDAAMLVLADVPSVWWVNSRIEGFGRQDPNNRALADLADRDDRARVIDWFAASDGRDWLHDHVHPNDAGQTALATLIARHLACDPSLPDRGVPDGCPP